ncbi:sigma-E factor negative regulatory protein [Xanthomonas citri pv. anacardii]|uniref:sigma-E factor negative regulatory protein n=1 Tax=Xanthomonas citri TaxID=346 RepID=UPI000CCC3493|nr:sigma-E factor negative regulatory protein [Xanthomonas citri]MCT8358101.1 sigma-E factor negative regulatory protein [Xanthomonas citri pv. anacardii]MCT8362159.1 sigma-E factor negative regulatory protein [Xanthomonas citri pv. anacardii]MCT8366210.1 sigma-E factor negative regulatory protein [Xanthomonas citri pv. anacardii]MCT8370234.1 sigma-E factor negative regulatory protein [Xanthomonas citri pv. anacardii]MCT8374198.1 sigma-E factor negative regulatory protein [Xanthomonas citri pv
MSHNPAMSTTDKFELHYRQQLSALVDGELSADESRFLLRRLAHDEELAGCHERWQLCGDVLRGAASAPAPLDFAARVRGAIAEEPAPQAQPAARPGARWRWGGGAAIAASVAAIAMFLARERLPDTAAPGAETPIYATAAQLPPASQTPQVPAGPKAPAAPAPGTPDEVAALAAAVPAAALASTRRGAATRNQQVARSAAARQQQAPTRMVAVAVPAPTETSSAVAATPSNPFTHPDTTLQARPWPRAALSGAGESPLNASFRQSRPGTAFYPFEPAPQAVASPAPNRPAPAQAPQD